ncbi:MAG: hypothetical protein FWH53_09775 [Leptospirales bacterium]|nr:hypothetical protein [Leptospirales bacterium]
MKRVVKYNHSDFTIDEFLRLKNNKKVLVVFSTFGEREADLIADKISVLKRLPHGVIDRIIVNHRRVGESSDKTENVISKLHEDVHIMVANSISVPDMNNEKGKGADMRRTLYRINTDRINIDYLQGMSAEDIIIVFLDADVLPEFFGSHFVIGLAGAVLKGADYAKAGFWREMGRVKKYVAQPLFSVIDHPSLKTLTEFSYPLSGECAGTLSFFNSVRFWQMYGVETGILIDASIGEYSLADINLGLYDHEHHNDVNIQKMSFGIIRAYFRSLIDYGIISINQGAAISDTFSAEYINSNSKRVILEENLNEIKYQPLNNIL